MIKPNNWYRCSLLSTSSPTKRLFFIGETFNSKPSTSMFFAGSVRSLGVKPIRGFLGETLATLESITLLPFCMLFSLKSKEQHVGVKYARAIELEKLERPVLYQ